MYQKRLLQQQLRLRAAEAEYQQQLLATAVQAQETERERIGRDLHDGIGSTLATAKLLAGRLENSSPTPESASPLGRLKEILGNPVQDVRGLSHSLYPAVLDRFGLAEALQHLADVSTETGTLPVELAIEYPQPLPPHPGAGPVPHLPGADSQCSEARPRRYPPRRAPAPGARAAASPGRGRRRPAATTPRPRPLARPRCRRAARACAASRCAGAHAARPLSASSRPPARAPAPR
ncbi:MAG: histidine kinase [Hymenobacter sp.]